MAALFRSQGAEVAQSGVRYRTWSEHDRVEVLIVTPGREIIRTVKLTREEGDYFSATDPDGKPGDLYRYRLGETGDWPDPASRCQPQGVHGPSMVIDPKTFRWTDSAWRAPSLRDLVFYELHIGTFTSEGTFHFALERLDHLARLGVNAIELMPIAEFPGERNWGYDGVSLYAPSRAYGEPDDLRALVDAAHARGLAMTLDVVYNHFGPDGNYAGCYHRAYWNPQRKTPWGAGLNFEEPAVRHFFAENPLYWMREFHIDGFRLDATHAIQDDSRKHILAEIAERVHAQGGFVVAEDERNEPALLLSPARGGLGLDGCWADDFHHIVRVMLSGEREGYYANYEGSVAELTETLAHGWLFRGQTQKTTGQPRGGDPTEAAAEQFIYCVSNHDQAGNRAFGDRLGHAISPAAYRAASALLCLIPQTPLLFMGQEWNASSPFQFFTDHTPDLGKKVTEGRRREFRHFAAFSDPALLQTIPDPQAESTFRKSKLRWNEVELPRHAAILALYREFLAIRRIHPAFRSRTRAAWKVISLDHGVVAILFGLATAANFAVVFDLMGGHEAPDLTDPRLAPADGKEWRTLISSNEPRFGGENRKPFREPTTIVLEAR